MFSDRKEVGEQYPLKKGEIHKCEVLRTPFEEGEYMF